MSARELQALRLFLKLGAALNACRWPEVINTADELARLAGEIIRKESTATK